MDVLKKTDLATMNALQGKRLTLAAADESLEDLGQWLEDERLPGIRCTDMRIRVPAAPS